MKKKQLNSKTKVSTIVIIGAVLITLYFNPSLQDPFNSPKFWILIIFSSILSGFYLLGNNRKSELFVTKLVGIFLLSGLISAILSNNTIVAFFGDTMRKNGFISYLSLSIVLLTVANNCNLATVGQLSNYVLIVTSILLVYGYLQSTGRDFVVWNNPYNSMILTSGNPNFSSALLAIFGTFLSIYLFRLKSKAYKIVYAITLGCLILTIYRTNSRQGLLAYVAAILIGIYFVLQNKYKLKSLIYLIVVILIFSLALLGTQKIGPLQSLLYKDSIDARQYYWLAALRMFTDHPTFGVGLDNYGNYFNLYRELGYVTKYGFDVTSTNAHNVILQHFSTGGFIFGSAYVVLQVYILRRVIKKLKTSSKDDFIAILAVFSSWFAYHVVSLVSIDNLVIAIWGWVFSGLLLAITSDKYLSLKVGNTSSIKQHRKSSEILQIQLSFLFSICAFVLCSFLYQSEKLMFEIRSSFNPQDTTSNLQVDKLANRYLKLPFNDVNYKSNIAIYLSDSGFFTRAEKIQLETLIDNPNSYETLNVLANLYESNKLPKKAIEIRERIVDLNPFNAKNLLNLAKNYKAIGNDQKSKSYLNEIKLITGISAFYLAAEEELSEGNE